MNNPWEFGWDAIGAIIGVLAFAVVLVVEWDKLTSSKALPNALFFIGMMLYGAGIGIAISQELLWWRIAGVVLAVFLGAFAGALLTDDDARKGLLTVHISGAVIGMLIGLMAAHQF